MASLCGISQLVCSQVNTDIAVWFCVNSCALKQNPNKDTFRFHTYSMDALISILKVLNYPYLKEVDSHLARTKALLSTFQAMKKMSAEMKDNFKKAIRCLSQNSVELDRKNIREEILKTEKFVNFVPVDGEPSEAQVNKILSMLPEDLRRLPIREIVAITNLVETQKSASDIQLDYDFIPDAVNKGEIHWSYGLKNFEKEKNQNLPSYFPSIF